MEKAILRTLAYADIFDFPLTSEEIFRFLISDESLDPDSFQTALMRMRAKKKALGTDKQGCFYFLPRRKRLVSYRRKREKVSQEKLTLARQTARIFRSIPTIRLIGVTGRLAVNNADKDDDLDFLIVTSRNRLWLTRLLVIVLSELLGKRRRPREKEVGNKICLNMFLDEDRLALPPEERDLYAAHEVVQMKPLWERGQTQARFLKANQWVTGYLPQSLIGEELEISSQKRQRSDVFRKPVDILEFFARRFQICYMGQRRTTEIVSSHRALFHPESVRGWVLGEYKKRLIRYGLSEQKLK